MPGEIGVVKRLFDYIDVDGIYECNMGFIPLHAWKTVTYLTRQKIARTPR